MKCRYCEAEIPGPDGKRPYEQAGVDGVQCEACAVSAYKETYPFWDISTLKQPVCVDALAQIGERT